VLTVTLLIPVSVAVSTLIFYIALRTRRGYEKLKLYEMEIVEKRRLRISKQDLQYVIVFAAVATIVTSSLAYVTLNPRPEEQFFASWVLGAQGMAWQRTTIPTMIRPLA
jgi:uncharacterized membrane protein